MKEITVRTLGRHYNVLIDDNLLAQTGNIMRQMHLRGKVLLITDNIVDILYKNEVAASLSMSGFEVFDMMFENGESVKTPDNFLLIIDKLSRLLFTRSDTVIALGGGTIGDLAGFAASAYMRGINLIHLPTTLLAAVDSSIGGKTGVNLQKGKNLLGSFYQPTTVIIDTGTIDSLPEKELKNGYAEIIKYGLLVGGNLNRLISENISDNLNQIIFECVKIKADIVEQDERESGLRKLLNLGHTTAHSIEKLSSYTISHGEAVGIGLSLAAKASVLYGYAEESLTKVVTELLLKYDMKTICSYSAEKLYESALADKKRSGDFIDFVLLENIGNPIIKSIPINDLLDIFYLMNKE